MARSRLDLNPDEAEEEIRRVASALCNRGTRARLARLITTEIKSYTPHDLMQIAAALRREIERLPPLYRKAYQQSAQEQIFGTHHRILLMEREGRIETLPGEIPDPALFTTFCLMMEEACLAPGQSGDAHMAPMGRLLYYLLSCFLIFILFESAHPIGTPFPGGMKVELKGGVVCCPVREKEDDVPYALCRFCPAHQS
ncbi:DUF2115 domain-containing protein [Methanocalculus taiwanensis]|uniref:UPF0305 protein FTO68_03505 n=1 Tax=Methanocalculus taiwanensis TaxID=106207 RepID=A0ABD4TJD9_9EURY|nr:DUF2115 domain-containing protein [Methanocalculus taiwanensis]MCQ1538058.1 DUF2115 domain-containing protein [Methanocalculus taiwanensis]